jgi:SAM-dependent methyltransferase
MSDMKESKLYNLLELPWLYRASQCVLAPGAKSALTRKISELLMQLPRADRILDVGCGPSSWLWTADLHPIGFDVSPSYTRAFSHSGEPAVTGSAVALPFQEKCFDAVWTIGLLHHLSDEMATQAVIEMARVCRPGGYILIIDAVLPESAWRRPIAYALRRADRGGFVRHEKALKTILTASKRCMTERFTYTYNGLEVAVCRLDPGTADQSMPDCPSPDAVQGALLTSS